MGLSAAFALAGLVVGSIAAKVLGFTFVLSPVSNPAPNHGWVGLGLVLVFWTVNWLLPGLRKRSSLTATSTQT